MREVLASAKQNTKAETEGRPMPYAPERKQHTRERIVGAAARLFNRGGFAEVTIGEIMTAAGLTHGGFYRHFSSKEELYAEAVRHFLKKEVPERSQKGLADACLPDQRFARFVVDAYLSRDHLQDVDGSCPLVGLSSDVARSSGDVRSAYREVAQAMVDVFKTNLKGRGARDQAMVLVALCVGGMVLARALDDEDLAKDFLDTAHKHALEMTGWRDGRALPSAKQAPREARIRPPWREVQGQRCANDDLEHLLPMKRVHRGHRRHRR